MYGPPQGGTHYPLQQQQFYQGYPPLQMAPSQYRQNYAPSNLPHNQQYIQPDHIQRGTYPLGNKNAALMQPPALHAESPMDTNSQFSQQQRGPMAMSNNQHSEFDGYQQQEEETMWTQEAQVASMFW